MEIGGMMKNLLALFTAAALASACSDGGMTAPTTTAHVSSLSALALTEGAASESAAASVGDCSLFRKEARRVVATAPGSFTMRMLSIMPAQ